MSDSEPIFRNGEVLSEAYEVRALIGEGGMGQVFDGHDRNLGRRIAIKANYPEMNHSVRGEARGLAAVRHPGVVGVYALGSANGVDYLVMEHVSGVTLARHLDRVATMPLAERLDVLIAIADGLAAIHRAGISHGDVKPDNVLLTPNGRVVLTDLGLVRAAYEPDEGLVQGTPAYMAPETVSPKYANGGWNLVDVYAFGITCFRVLAGTFPFTGETDFDMVIAHAEHKPAVLEGMPKRLSELVDQMLAKEPTDRPTMDAILFQLRSIATQQTAPAKEAATGDPFRVLVVDDDADIARLVGMYVKQAAPHAEVLTAPDAQRALEIFRDKPPKLVFLDLNMPKMSGFELFTYLRGVRLVDASTVVAMSAGGSATDVQLMLELGAHDFIPKGPELRGRVTKIVQILAKTEKTEKTEKS